MNLRQLRTFATIAESGSFAGAARQLNLSQPALSRQIQGLEVEWGVSLFERVGHRVRLTSSGEGLLRQSRELLAQSEALTERAKSLNAGESGILRVAATPQVLENLVARFIPRYRELHPAVELHLLESGGAELHEFLDRGDAHLVLDFAGDRRFTGLLLYPMHLIAVMPASHTLGRRTKLEMTSLADHPLLILKGGFGSREWFDAACQSARMRPELLLESGVPQTLVALAEANYGIAILPSNVTIPSGLLRSVPLVHRGQSLGRWAQIARHPQRFLPAYGEQFIEELTAYCKRDFPGRALIRRAPPLLRPR